jgi:hypothetical protein
LLRGDRRAFLANESVSTGGLIGGGPSSTVETGVDIHVWNDVFPVVVVVLEVITIDSSSSIAPELGDEKPNRLFGLGDVYMKPFIPFASGGVFSLTVRFFLSDLAMGWFCWTFIINIPIIIIDVKTWVRVQIIIINSGILLKREKERFVVVWFFKKITHAVASRAQTNESPTAGATGDPNNSPKLNTTHKNFIF